jgi:thioredoxin-like negative regulator of GroEL
LIDALDQLLTNRDFEGAETLLYDALASWPVKRHAELHLHLARVYRAWNKLTSAIDHVMRAAERGTTDAGVRRQIDEQLASLRRAQSEQNPI